MERPAFIFPTTKSMPDISRHIQMSHACWSLGEVVFPQERSWSGHSCSCTDWGQAVCSWSGLQRSCTSFKSLRMSTVGLVQSISDVLNWLKTLPDQKKVISCLKAWTFLLISLYYHDLVIRISGMTTIAFIVGLINFCTGSFTTWFIIESQFSHKTP